MGVEAHQLVRDVEDRPGFLLGGMENCTPVKETGSKDRDFGDTVLDILPNDPSDAAYLTRDGKTDGTSVFLPVWFIMVGYRYGCTAPPGIEWCIYVTSRAKLWRLSGTLIAPAGP